MNIPVEKIYTAYMYSYPHKTAYRLLNNINIKNYYGALNNGSNSLYVHVPFCETKCGYCNLFSIAKNDTEYFGAYISAVEDHAKSLELPTTDFSSVVIGGGTPLILAQKQLEQLFLIGSEIFNIDYKTVFSCIETSPNQTTKEKLKILEQFDTNRISIGVQSYNESELKVLKRSHNTKAIKSALELIRHCNFNCLNVDLIYGIPNQTIDSLKKSVDFILKYYPDEIFIYPLYVRKNMPMESSSINSETYNMYLFLRDYLLEKGYFQTSMRRFTKTLPLENKSCGFENSIAIGCGGRSYLGNLHFCSPYEINPQMCHKQIDAYINQVNKTENLSGIFLDETEEKIRFIIKNLFYYTGLDLLEYKKLFLCDALEENSILKDFLASGYAVLIDTVLKLTPLGLSISDYLGSQFISPNIKELMRKWDEND